MFRKMSAFNYTKERPAESVFSDIQTLNKFADAVSQAQFMFKSYIVYELVVLANSNVHFAFCVCVKTLPEVDELRAAD